MKKVKLKFNHDEITCILNILHEQVIQGGHYRTLNPTKEYKSMCVFITGHIVELYAKHFHKTCFSYTGVRTFNLSPLQGYALMLTIENGWLESTNQWTRNILQVTHNRIHKQVAA